MKAIQDETQQERAEASREAAKLAKKAEFDRRYDGGGSRAVDKAGAASDEEQEDGAAHNADSQSKKKGKGWSLCAPYPVLHAGYLYELPSCRAPRVKCVRMDCRRS